MKPVVVILGAGISGLSLAWYMKQALNDEIELKILEKSHRAGGWIQTIQHEDYLFEQGPRSCRSKGNGTATLNLVEELGLQDQVIAADPAAHIRYIYRQKKLQPLPHNLWSFIKSPYKGLIARSLFKDLIAARGTLEDESISSFITRRFGTALAHEFMDPLVSGIFAGDIQHLSMPACFPALFNKEQEHRSIFLSSFARHQKPHNSPFVQKMQKSSLFTFKDGMETLPKALAKRLEEHLFYQRYATGLKVHNHGVDLFLNDGSTLQADYLYSTLPCYEVSHLLDCKPLHTIPYESVAVINFGFKNQVIKTPGFGYLIPSTEKEKILGVVWDSSAFSCQNAHSEQTRLTVMIGGSHFPNFNTYNREDFIAFALEALARQMNIQTSPDVILAKIAHRAIPQYLVGYEANLREIERAIPSSRISLLGNSFRGISVNDCIANSTKVGIRIAKKS